MAVLTETFESYVVGDLNGQGSWSGSINFDVQSTTVYAGSNAVSALSTASNAVCSIPITSFTDEVQSWYMRADGVTANGGVTFYSGVSQFETNIHFRSSGNIQVYSNIGAGLTYNTVASYVANTWYLVDCEFRSSDSKVRVRINGGTWTDWGSTTTTWASITEIGLNTATIVGTTFFWDSFFDGSSSPPPSLLRSPSGGVAIGNPIMY